jgi:phenylpyruvate tautomerase
MPLATIRTNVTVTEEKLAKILSECSRTLAKLTGKPEGYVMTVLEPSVAMTMAGTTEPTCLMEIRSIGQMTSQQTKALSKGFCELLSRHLGVDTGRIYLNFTDVSGSMWGHDGGTFG